MCSLATLTKPSALLDKTQSETRFYFKRDLFLFQKRDLFLFQDAIEHDIHSNKMPSHCFVTCFCLACAFARARALSLSRSRPSSLSLSLSLSLSVPVFVSVSLSLSLCLCLSTRHQPAQVLHQPRGHDPEEAQPKHPVV